VVFGSTKPRHAMKQKSRIVRINRVKRRVEFTEDPLCDAPRCLRQLKA
jgi:hypothetical protein